MTMTGEQLVLACRQSYAAGIAEGVWPGSTALLSRMQHAGTVPRDDEFRQPLLCIFAHRDVWRAPKHLPWAAEALLAQQNEADE